MRDDDRSGAGAVVARWEVAGDAVDSAMDVLPGLYAGRHWGTWCTDAPYSYRYAAIGTHHLSLRRSSMRGRLRGDLEPGSEYIVQSLLAGWARFDVGEHRLPIHARPSLVPVDRAVLFSYADYEQRLVHLDKERVAVFAAERWDLGDGPLRLRPSGRPTPGEERAWWSAVAAASRAFLDPDAAPLHRDAAVGAVIRMFLRLNPPAADPLPSGTATVDTARVRTVVEHIRDHAHEPLTVGDLARAAGFSERALQASFAAVMDTTPMRYLHGVRLDRAREDLLRLSPRETTVSRVARSWGILHPGRFSLAYAERFGEHPRETLRR